MSEIEFLTDKAGRVKAVVLPKFCTVLPPAFAP